MDDNGYHIQSLWYELPGLRFVVKKMLSSFALGGALEEMLPEERCNVRVSCLLCR